MTQHKWTGYLDQDGNVTRMPSAALEPLTVAEADERMGDVFDAGMPLPADGFGRVIAPKPTREHYALAAMQGLLANGDPPQAPDVLAAQARAYADALMAEMGK